MTRLIGKPEEVARDHYLLRLDAGDAVSAPGQFVTIKPGEGTDPLLRRPFSLFDHHDGVIEIVVRVVGRGTGLISRAGGELDMLGPMGRGFSLERAGSALLVGGGVGCAPLNYLARALKAAGVRVTMLFGASSSGFVYCRDEFIRNSHDFHVTTDDGSEGRGGAVVSLMAELLAAEKYDRIYCCGPTVMMKKAVELAGPVPVEISVENYFGCGFGICAGCTIETTSGLKRACVHGPVFDGRSVILGSLG